MLPASLLGEAAWRAARRSVAQPACLPCVLVPTRALPCLPIALAPIPTPPSPHPPHALQDFEEQRDLLDSLARKLGLAAPSVEQAPPFSDPRWSWQLPEADLIPETSHLQPPRQLPLEAAAPAAAAGEGQPAAAADPRLEAAAAAELRAAREWYHAAEVPLPEFAMPQQTVGRADSGLSWSQTPRAQGQAEVNNAAPAIAAMGAGEGASCLHGQFARVLCAWCGCGMAAWLSAGASPEEHCCSAISSRPVYTPPTRACGRQTSPPRSCSSDPLTANPCLAPACADGLYAPAAPRHDDAFHHSLGATLASAGQPTGAAEGPAEIEEGYWQALQLRGHALEFTEARWAG